MISDRACAFEHLGLKMFEARPSRAEPIRLRYQAQLSVTTGEAEIAEQLRQASLLIASEAKGAADIPALIARAKADRKRITSALYEIGRYGGAIDILIDGRSLDDVRAHEDRRTEATLAVAISVDPGPVFSFGRLEFRATAATPASLPASPAAYGLVVGQPARSGRVVKAIDRLVEEWRMAGYPFARVSRKEISADHASHTLDVLVEVDPGQPAVYGWLNVTGVKDLDPQMVRRYSALRAGAPYNASDLRKAGERLRKLDAIQSVRVRHGETLAGDGGLPVTLAISEREKRFIGAAASASSVDGAEVKAYWGHRNLFGGAERLKVEGGVSQIGERGPADLQYQGKVTLTKPGIADIDTDLVSEFSLVKEHPETYESRAAKAKVGLARRFSETRTGSIALAATLSREEDAFFGSNSYAITSLPSEIQEDQSDSRLDPTRGWRVMMSAEPAHDFAHGDTFLTGKAQLTRYQSVDSESQLVFAGRVSVASILGTDVESIPPTLRLYAGGGGSVRGYAYRSIGPEFGGVVVGGLSLFEGSAELRWRITPSIGLVPFVDFASVSAGSWPTLSNVRIGAGIGLRYYTGLGPVRLDVGVPIDRPPGGASVAFYIGLGQAF
jgi:translocation and assembly module TamA